MMISKDDIIQIIKERIKTLKANQFTDDRDVNLVAKITELEFILNEIRKLLQKN